MDLALARTRRRRDASPNLLTGDAGKMTLSKEGLAPRPVAAPAPVYLRVRFAILLSLSLMYFIAYIDRTNISVAAPLMANELGLTKTQLGFVFSIFAYPYTVMQITGGWLADRFGPRLVLLVLCLIWSAATFLTGTVGGAASLVVMRVLVGIGEGGAFPTATRAMTFWFPPQERGLAQGVTHSFARLGGAVTPPLVIAIVTYWGWRAAFFSLGASPNR